MSGPLTSLKNKCILQENNYVSFQNIIYRYNGGVPRLYNNPMSANSASSTSESSQDVSTSKNEKSKKNVYSFPSFSLPKFDFVLPTFSVTKTSNADKETTLDQIGNLKSELIKKASSVKKGLVETDEDQIEINLLISKLEALNPSTSPLTDTRLTARWKLIYTSSEAILGRSRFDAFRPKDDIVQKIDATKGRARNEETLIPISFLPSFKIRNSVDARLEINLEENERNQTKNRVKVFFEQFNIGPYIKIKTENENYLDITYLDDNMRISRGGKGNVFVLINNNSIQNWSIDSYDEESIVNETI